MILFTKRNIQLLLLSLSLITAGFLVMKFDPSESAYGFWALTIGPVMVVVGFIFGIISVFHDMNLIACWKGQWKMLIAGWSIFVVSFAVFQNTMEQTASLWDCAEFIACAYKLQVPHAPGAPLFLMIGRIFTLFSFGEVTKVAYWVNMTSVLSSAVTVMFVFWSIVMLARKINPKSSDFSLMLAGSVGASSIAFADSFWFSAVEAETYAMATLFLVVCFWSILKWEQVGDGARDFKWLIFIFYTLGLSVGVHPMSLLVLPAIAVIIFFKNRKFSWRDLLIAISLGAIGILFLNHVVLFGLPDMMKYADLFFVNVLGMPFYSGAIVMVLLLFIAGYLVYKRSIVKRQKIMSVVLVGLMYFLIGYSSYFMIIIRSQANPSIDEHNPENLMTLASYLKRESYGTRPFLYGPNFTGKIQGYKKGSAVYTMMDDHYEITDHKTEYEYRHEDQTILPRMYSNRPKHISAYKEWTGLKDGEKPKFLENVLFMIRYQFGHMYLRYLMFNFSGRASDIQHADWLSPLDGLEKLPDFMKNNKARNNFFMLPFLLGILGLVFQYKRDKGGFWATMAFFLFLGLILVFYLNSTPNEPRERDYIYVGSYVAFACWIGLGALGVYQFFGEKVTKYPWVKYSSLLAMFVPLSMFMVGYDDHNRSGRTLQVDHARNTLASCAPNAILFTGGDNDTFPLWYIQEVEGFRTDVRVIVLSYFNGDWYIDQMHRQVYDSDPLLFSIQKNQYRQGGLNDVLPYVKRSGIDGPINLHRFLDLVRQESKIIQVEMSDGTKYNSIPSDSFFIEFDKEIIQKSAMVPNAFRNDIPEKLTISWDGNYMEKSTFMALDLIASNQWQRPIYFNITSLNSITMDLKKHVLQEGMVYRLLPIELVKEGAIDTEKMYSNLMEKWHFHDLKNANTYYNHEDYQLRILQTTKSCFNQLARALFQEGQIVKAKEVITFLYSNFGKENIDDDATLLSTIELLTTIGEGEKAQIIAERLFTKANQHLFYLKNRHEVNSSQGQLQLFILRQLGAISASFNDDDFSIRCSEKVLEYSAIN